MTREAITPPAMTPAAALEAILPFARVLLAAGASAGAKPDPTLVALLERGEGFVGFKPSAADPEAERFRKRFRPKKRECWYNAQSFALWAAREGLGGYRYMEGFILRVIPLAHGFIVGPDGAVIDHTIEASNRHLRSIGIEVEREDATPYAGVEVPAADVAASWTGGWSRPVLSSSRRAV